MKKKRLLSTGKWLERQVSHDGMSVFIDGTTTTLNKGYCIVIYSRNGIELRIINDGHSAKSQCIGNFEESFFYLFYFIFFQAFRRGNRKKNVE